MKFFTFFLLFAFLGINAYSQSPLVITKSNFKANLVDDTLIFNDTQINQVTIAKGANCTWDLSVISEGDVSVIKYFSPTNTSFPNATWRDENAGEKLNAAYVIYFNNYFGIEDNGYTLYGTETSEQRYGMGQVTMNNDDSLIVLQESNPFPVPYRIIPFPLTDGFSNKVEFTRICNFYITVTAFGLNNAKCTKKTFINSQDSVVGWGKVLLPNSEGLTQWNNGLLVQKHRTTLDSFYLNGAPAPALLVSGFGLGQGATTEIYNYYIYSNISKNYLALFNSDKDLASINYIYFLKNVPKLIDDVEYNTEAQVSAVYPNPVNDRSVSIKFKKPLINDSKLKIINSIGELVATYDVTAAVSILNLSLPDELAAGVYYYSLNDNNDTVTGNFIIQ